MYIHISRDACVEEVKHSSASESNALAWKGKPEAVGWRWLDDTMVSLNVAQYGEALRKVYPFVRFMPYPSVDAWNFKSLAGQGDMVRMYHRVCVFVDDARYSPLSIGYGKYGVKASSEYTYITCARSIDNRGCKPNLEQSSMRKTTTLDRAVKNALKYFVGYSTKEIAVRDYRQLTRASIEVGAKKAVVLPTLLKTITHAVLINEIRALKAAGVTFTTAEFVNVAQQCDDAVRLSNEERHKRVDAVFVRFLRAPGGGTEIECYESKDIRNYPTTMQSVHDNVFKHTAETLPSFMTEKIAVLQMMNDGDHVDGIGVKLDALTYWVEK